MLGRDLYNKDIKLRFLQEYDDESTQQAYEYVLSKSKKLEDEFGKDVYDFNDLEIDALLGDLQAKSESSIKYQKSIFTKYVEWAIEEGFRNSKVNFFDLPKFTGKNLYNFIHKVWQENKFMTREDIYKVIIDECVNAQDGAIFALIFEGAFGVGLDELINLKRTDINTLENKLTLTRDNGSTRVIQVPESCIEVTTRAANEMKYQKTMMSEENDGKINSKEYKLIDSDYVFRFTNRKSATDYISNQALRQRFMKIKKYYDNPYLTQNSVRLSGMIDMAKRIMFREGIKELDIKHYKEINKQFGIEEEKYSATKTKIDPYL